MYYMIKITDINYKIELPEIVYGNESEEDRQRVIEIIRKSLPTESIQEVKCTNIKNLEKCIKRAIKRFASPEVESMKYEILRTYA